MGLSPNEKKFKKWVIFDGYFLYFAAICFSSDSASGGGEVKRLIKTVRNVEIIKAGTSS